MTLIKEVSMIATNVWENGHHKGETGIVVMRGNLGVLT